MSDVVWVSNVMNDVRLDRDINTDLNERNIDLVIDTIKRNEAGEPLDASLFPKAIFPGPQMNGLFKRMPHLFKAGSYWIVSKQVADVLREYDLGGARLYPVKVFQKDHKTQVEGEFFCLNFGNVKKTFLPNESSGRLMRDENPLRFYMPYVPVDFEVAVSALALTGSNIWIEPLLRRTFFISDQLQTALKKAKVDGAFRLFKCRVIAAN